MKQNGPLRPDTTPRFSRWAWIRALLITLIVGMNFIQASPAPGKVDKKKATTDPIAMEELGRWVQLFSWFGIQRTPAEIAEFAGSFPDEWRAWKRTITTPMKPFWKMTATQQGWGLFTYPDTHPYSSRYRFEAMSRNFERCIVRCIPT